MVVYACGHGHGHVSGFTAPGSPRVCGGLVAPSPTRGSLRRSDRSAIVPPGEGPSGSVKTGGGRTPNPTPAATTHDPPAARDQKGTPSALPRVRCSWLGLGKTAIRKPQPKALFRPVEVSHGPPVSPDSAFDWMALGGIWARARSARSHAQRHASCDRKPRPGPGIACRSLAPDECANGHLHFDTCKSGALLSGRGMVCWGL